MTCFSCFFGAVLELYSLLDSLRNTVSFGHHKNLVICLQCQYVSQIARTIFMAYSILQTTQLILSQSEANEKETHLCL